MTDPAPWPLIEIAIEPNSEADQEKLDVALQKLAAEDPTLRVFTDQESGLAILGGMSELHLDIKVDILKRTHKVEANIGAQQVAYREALGRPTEIDRTHKKHLGPMSQFARVKILFEPGEPGSGYVFESKIVGGSVPEEYVPGVEKGIAIAKDDGLLAGYPVIDFKATLVDGAYHDVDSSVMAFQIAAQAAFHELREKASPRLLEPIMNVEVKVPEDYVGDVIRDLNSRRGFNLEAGEDAGQQVVTSLVPLSCMFGYASTLRSMTQGRGDFCMDYDHYEAVPQTTPPDDNFPAAMAMRA